MSIGDELRKLFTVGRPLVEQWIDLSEEFAALREAAAQKGIDWSQVKGLLKAQVQDERDGSDGKRVGKIIEKADCASSYADMLGLGSEKNKSRPQSSAAPVVKSPAVESAAPKPPAPVAHRPIAELAHTPVAPSTAAVPPPIVTELDDIPQSLRRDASNRAEWMS